MKTGKAEKPLLGITMGDPAGIGPEVIVKALSRPVIRRLCRPLVIGSVEVLARAVSFSKVSLKLRSVNLGGFEASDGAIPVLDPLRDPLGPFTPGKVSQETGAAQAVYIKEAVERALDGSIAALVTAPISKEAINLAGYAYPGHTEMLADLTGAMEVGMMIVGGQLRILLGPLHAAIKDVPALLTPERIAQAIRLCHRGLTELFGIKRPRIAVAALTPHAGAGGLFGTEERTAIGPGLQTAPAEAFPSFGP